MKILKALFGGSDEQLGDKHPQIMSPVEAKALIDADNHPFILDVREPNEFSDGHIDGAKVIPIGQLENRFGELPEDKTILCVCASGSRSSAAARMLAASNLDVINLRGK